MFISQDMPLQAGDTVEITIKDAIYVGISSDGISGTSRALFDVEDSRDPENREPCRVIIPLDTSVQMAIRMPKNWRPGLGTVWSDRFSNVWFVARTAGGSTWMVRAGDTTSTIAEAAWSENGPLRPLYDPPSPPEYSEPPF